MSDLDNVFLRGWLKKRSGGIVSRMQKRYCLISRDDFMFYYFSNEKDTKPAGSISLANLSFARIADTSRGCCRFELRAEGQERVYVFEARNNTEAAAWLDVVNLAREGAAKSGTQFRSSAPSSACVNVRISGYLLKTSHNSFVLRPQRRFVAITENDQTLRYYKHETDKEAVASLKLADMEYVRRVDGCRFEVKLSSQQRVFIFQAPTEVESIMWIDACRGNPSSSYDSSASRLIASLTPVMAGYLGKRSHNKYVRSLQKLQRRYVIITKEDSCLRYYRSSDDGAAGINMLGCCNLVVAEFVRVYDKTLGCRMFEVGEADGRVYGFECCGESVDAVGKSATTPEQEVWQWIDCIEDCMAAAAKQAQALENERIRSTTPPLVLLFDENGTGALFMKIQSDMNSLKDACQKELEGYAAAAAAAAAAAEAETESQRNTRVSSEFLLKRHAEEVAALQSGGSSNDIFGIPSWDDAWDGGGGDDDGGDDSDSDSEEEEEESTRGLAGNKALRAYANYARHMLGYFASTLPQFQKNVSHPPRYDILCLFVTEFNAALSNGMMYALQPNSSALQRGQLVDLLPIIILLSQHETRLNTLYCPDPGLVQEESGSPRRSTYFEKQIKFSCPLSNEIHHLCTRYTEGSAMAPGLGAAFKTHSMKCWKRLLAQPAEHLKRHQDGSFFTSMPTDTWTAFHNQLLLGSSSGASPVLPVVIAQQVGLCLQDLVAVQKAYVISSSSSSSAKVTQGAATIAQVEDLAEIELEFFSGLANDFALHIEEILILMQRFSQPGPVRDQLDSCFDDVTQSLVSGGRVCIGRLVDIVVGDVQEVLGHIFTTRWLEHSGDMEAVLVTINDYLRDFESYLLPFWSAKFVQMLLENLVVCYTWAVLRRGNAGRAERLAKEKEEKAKVQAMSVTERARGAFEYLFKSSSSSTAATAGGGTVVGDAAQCEGDDAPSPNEPCRANAETLGRLSRDINALNAFFKGHIQEEAESDAVLALIYEILLMCQSEPMKVVAHAVHRVSEYPSVALSIIWTAQACLSLREDIDESELEECTAALKLSVEGAHDIARYNEESGICEPGRLGLMFADLAALGGGFSSTSSKSSDANTNTTNLTANSLAQRVRNLANIPFVTLQSAVSDLVRKEEEEVDDGQAPRDGTERLTAGTTLLTKRSSTQVGPPPAPPTASDSPTSARKLIDDALTQHQLDQQAAAREVTLRIRESLQREQQVKENRSHSSALFSLEGHLDKRSPAFPVWQHRFFRLTHRHESDSTQPIYTLLWYKKAGGTVLNSLLLTDIVAVTLEQSNRAVCYSRSTNMVSVDSEYGGEDGKVVDAPSSKVILELPPAQSLVELDTVERFAFTISCRRAQGSDGGKSHLLRASSVDKVLKWMNTLAGAAGLVFDDEGRRGFVCL